MKIATLMLLLVLPLQVSAYAGLGPILPLIGSGIVLLFMFVMTFMGLILYPLKKFWGTFKKSKSKPPREKQKKQDASSATSSHKKA